jgi:hypothetical protein
MLLGGADAIAAGIFYIVHPVGIAWLIHWWDRRRPPKPSAPAPKAPVPAAPASAAGDPDPA